MTVFIRSISPHVYINRTSMEWCQLWIRFYKSLISTLCLSVFCPRAKWAKSLSSKVKKCCFFLFLHLEFLLIVAFLGPALKMVRVGAKRNSTFQIHCFAALKYILQLHVECNTVSIFIELEILSMLQKEKTTKRRNWPHLIRPLPVPQWLRQIC